MLSASVLCIPVNGMDQAKFRVPRKLVLTHAFEKLLRPALHVQGLCTDDRLIFCSLADIALGAA
jgi:hypothetical protein